LSKAKITNLQKLADEYASGMSTVQLAKQYNTAPITINSWLKRHGVILRSLSEAHADVSGENNPKFKARGSYAKDGVYLSPDVKGYLRRTVLGHPLASKRGLIGEHVYQACLHWGVEQVRGNDVHHKDNNKANNAIDNLEILPRRAHRKIENNFRGVVLENGVSICVNCRRPIENPKPVV
jgi:hypothetical protein